MTKQDFITALRGKLKKFPNKEVEDRISFYCEIIDDSIEEGLTEEQALLKLGSVDDIANQIASQIPLRKIVKHNVKPTRKLKVWETILLIVGSPIWLSLLISLFAVVFSVFASLWSVDISFWAITIAFVVCGPLAVILGFIFIFVKSGAEGFAMIGAGLVLLGLGILFVFLSKLITALLVKLTKLLILAVKKAFLIGGKNNEINN